MPWRCRASASKMHDCPKGLPRGRQIVWYLLACREPGSAGQPPKCGDDDVSSITLYLVSSLTGKPTSLPRFSRLTTPPFYPHFLKNPPSINPAHRHQPVAVCAALTIPQSKIHPRPCLYVHRFISHHARTGGSMTTDWPDGLLPYCCRVLQRRLIQEAHPCHKQCQSFCDDPTGINRSGIAENSCPNCVCIMCVCVRMCGDEGFL